MTKLKVLIVDDSSVMREDRPEALREAGLDIAEVPEASEGAEALGEVQKGSLDLILSDINMLVMGGLEFQKSVGGVEAAKGVPVIMIRRGAFRPAPEATSACRSLRNRPKSVLRRFSPTLFKTVLERNGTPHVSNRSAAPLFGQREQP